MNKKESKSELDYLRGRIFDLKIRVLIIKKNYDKYTYPIQEELEKIYYELKELEYQYLYAGGKVEDLKEGI